MMATILLCSVIGCGQTGVLVCGVCKLARYCGVDCQKSHWTMKHKLECNTGIKIRIQQASYSGNLIDLVALIAAAAYDQKNPQAVVRTVVNWANNDNGATAACVAAQGGYDACLSVLHANGANLKKANKFGYGPIHSACAGGRFRCLRLLLAAGIDPKTPTSSDESIADTPAKLCIVYGHVACLMLLYEADVSPNTTDRHGRNHLHLAAHHGDLKAIQLAFKKGGDINLCDFYGRTPMDHASVMEKSDCVALLRSFGGHKSPRPAAGLQRQKVLVNTHGKVLSPTIIPSSLQDAILAHQAASDVYSETAIHAKTSQRRARVCEYERCCVAASGRCPECRVTFYCTSAHAALHREDHKDFCELMIRVCDKLECQERATTKCRRCKAFYCKIHICAS